MSFADVVSLLDHTRVVAIVTRRDDGARTATPIWSVVVDGVPYVRSAYGEKSWWWRHVVAGRDAEFVLADGAIAERDKTAALDLPSEFVGLERVPVGDAVQSAISDAIATKYASEPSSVAPMVSPDAIACTVRVIAPAR